MVHPLEKQPLATIGHRAQKRCLEHARRVVRAAIVAIAIAATAIAIAATATTATAADALHAKVQIGRHREADRIWYGCELSVQQSAPLAQWAR
jgi:Spy/CpxP family protein refolding chaperone